MLKASQVKATVAGGSLEDTGNKIGKRTKLYPVTNIGKSKKVSMKTKLKICNNRGSDFDDQKILKNDQ